MEQQIKEILEHELQGADVTLEDMPSGRYSGVIQWQGFENHDFVDRQKTIPGYFAGETR